MLRALFRFLSYFPLPVLHGIGAGLGWLVYCVSPTYRHRLQENIRQAGYEVHLNNAVSEGGKSMFELPFIWYASPHRVFKKVKIEHWDMVEKSLAQHQGIIFLTPHLGCFELCAQVIARQTPITALYRPPRKKILQPLMEDARTRTNLALAPANLSGVRKMVKALKNRQAVGLLPDQVPQQGEGIWMDFFGRPAYTMTLPSKLHQMTNAPVIAVYAERLSFGRGYVVRFVPFEGHTSEDGNDSTRAINAAMEKLIARCPAQYIWSYNRYKKPANAPANASAATTSTLTSPPSIEEKVKESI